MGARRKHSERPEKIFRALVRLLVEARRKFFMHFIFYVYNKTSIRYKLAISSNSKVSSSAVLLGMNSSRAFL